MNRFHDIDCEHGHWWARSHKPVRPTRQQLHDEGRIDGIPAMTVDRWNALAAEREARLARLGDIFPPCPTGYNQYGKCGRPVIRHGGRGYHPRRFDTVSQAERHMGVSPGEIANAIRRGGRCRGFRWQYADRWEVAA